MFPLNRNRFHGGPAVNLFYSSSLFCQRLAAHSLFKNLFPAVIPVLGAKDVTEGEGLSR